VDVQKKLDEIVDSVGNARSMPMSASCVVNRAELLAMLEEVREALPGSLAQAEEVIDGHQQLAAQARDEADRIIQEAHAQRSSIVSETGVARRSQEEADRILTEARREAEEIRAEADDYVDSKLANFEVVLTKTIGSVDRGREKLLGRDPGQAADGAGYQDDQDDQDDQDAPEYSSDPDTLIRRADDYVDAKLGAFEAVLSKTLDAVGRGRQKLHGRTASDDLGAHMAAQDAAGAQGLVSDSDFLSDLAEPEQRAGRAVPPPPEREPASVAAEAQPQIPAQTQQPYQDAGYPQQPGYQDADYGANGTGGYPDPAYAAADQGYTGYQQDAYQYQQDPYAYQQQGYAQQADPQAQPQAQGYDQGYGWQQPSEEQQQAQQPAQSSLDETSFFDTSMIDLEELRRYEQGR
jgi:cell division septum initiation protein DivIVA